jgi:hypothetical protein
MMPSQDTIIRNKLFSLKKSKFRSKFKLSQKERDYTSAKGIEGIRSSSPSTLRRLAAGDAFKSGMESKRAGR